MQFDINKNEVFYNVKALGLKHMGFEFDVNITRWKTSNHWAAQYSDGITKEGRTEDDILDK